MHSASRRNYHWAIAPIHTVNIFQIIFSEVKTTRERPRSSRGADDDCAGVSTELSAGFKATAGDTSQVSDPVP